MTRKDIPELLLCTPKLTREIGEEALKCTKCTGILQITLKEKREHMNYNKLYQNTYKRFAHRFLELDNV